MSIRSFEDRDRAAVLALLAGSLGWVADEHHEAFFRWKHEGNPFGRSFAWVAEDPRAGVVGFRTFLRWRFELPGGGTVEAVRAVDTATAASHRGAGIFSRLTRHGLGEIEAEGIRFVFNTPNDQSRPGYLKLGWREVGRLPAQLRPGSVWALPRILRSRVPADLWSVSSDAGLSAGDALEGEGVATLLDSEPRTGAMRTERSLEHLRWRYAGFPALGYRAVLGGTTAADGIAIFRLRRRGAGTECALVDVLTPDGDARSAGRLAALALRSSGADHAIGLAPDGRWPGFVRSARLGPILTVRSVGTEIDAGTPEAWALGLGDVELF